MVYMVKLHIPNYSLLLCKNKVIQNVHVYPLSTMVLFQVEPLAKVPMTEGAAVCAI